LSRVQQRLSIQRCSIFPAPVLQAYPRETVIAEKLEALTALGLLNSRMKDYYDIALLSRLYSFEGEHLMEAIVATFRHRRTTIEAEPIGLADVFSADPAKRSNGGLLFGGAGSMKNPPTWNGSRQKFVFSFYRFWRRSARSRPSLHSSCPERMADEVTPNVQTDPNLSVRRRRPWCPLAERMWSRSTPTASGRSR
jgi:hypothetical protein